MSDPIRIWLEISHHGPFQVGGWAFVRADGAEVAGQAGGERRVDAERAALAGFLAALKGLADGRRVRLHTASELLADIPLRIASVAAGGEPPAGNLDLWGQAAAALGRRPVDVVRTAREPATPSAFAAAWAELGRDRAKDRGPFAAPIPRSNLAKAGV